ncbi:AGL024Wp [Eremothecium gossypii ATCC 10895]|uniref:AGL024Wp n=1 Tax=Eremothecium gossypii (strain ATCC 10895 / CBS 109.51 / FGSC 9923 / NRRL Y-1056) TaxID=284811 RepID=Q750H5_EREGS|nr:AGL024Wp [Eremothecium gossypii ATCC 10895]AAS54466.1 AGL024Wp [Eremothecium gossypii ATCC 10895]AEY98797.1 FAGL024Wp [Eremothecium gossypii FDAG1]
MRKVTEREESHSRYSVSTPEYPLATVPVPYQYKIEKTISRDEASTFLLGSLGHEPPSLKRRQDSEEPDLCEASSHKRSKTDADELTPNSGFEQLGYLKGGDAGGSGGAADVQRADADAERAASDADRADAACAEGAQRDGEAELHDTTLSADEGAATGLGALVGAVVEEALPISPLASPGYTPPFSGLQGGVEAGNSLVAHRSSLTLQDTMQNIATNAFLQLPHSAFKNLVFQLLSKLNRSELSDLSTYLKDHLKRDFLQYLPMEVSMNILNNLDFEDICSCLLVNRTWNNLIRNSPYLWKHMMLSEGFVTEDCFSSYCDSIPEKHRHLPNPSDRFRLDFLENRWLLENWCNPCYRPGRTCLDGHRTKVVTCFQFEGNYIITGADDKRINVYDADREQFKLELVGHEGGVWALKYAGDEILVSGSTDRTVRIWNVKAGKCTHVFRGHTSTVRCLDVVEHGGIKYVVTGSRDNTLHVWKLPDPNSPDYNPNAMRQFNSIEDNPFFVGVLRGHMASVRTVSGHGNIVVSGSYDHNLMVWDIAKMKLLYVLTGHTDRIYSTLYDHKRKRCISASMDTTVKVWDLSDINNNGPVSQINSTSALKVSGSVRTLCGHTALVGLLGLSDKYLVSAAADGSLRGWDASDYSKRFSFHHTNQSAITTFFVSDNILVSGSEHQFNIYDLRTGRLVHRHLLNDAAQIWGVKFNNRKLVVAVESEDHSYVEILDFGSRNRPVTYMSMRSPPSTSNSYWNQRGDPTASS